MSDWKPKVCLGLRWESLNLSAQEGFLLSRIDGHTSVSGLTHLTGLTIAQVNQTLKKLEVSGAIDPPQGGSIATTAPAAEVAPPTHSQGQVTLVQPVLFSADASASAERFTAVLNEMTSDNLTQPTHDGAATEEGVSVFDHRADLPSSMVPAPINFGHEPIDTVDLRADTVDATQEEQVDAKIDAKVEDQVEEQVEEQVDGDELFDGADEDRVDFDDDEEDEPSDDAAAEIEESNHRKHFETKLHDLPQEQREQLARVESGDVLCALCFDPVALVIQGIVENPSVGFPHARLIARHHRTPQGLDALLKCAEFARNGKVQQFLLANPMLQDTHLKRILQPKRLGAVYKLSLSRDIPEKNRNKIRYMLRAKWSTSEGDERAKLVFGTDGRVLLMLAGLPMDSTTTTLLCSRTYNSTTLIQHLARFSSTPPPLIVHLLRQAVVKRHVHIRSMLLQHCNCPSDVKRKIQL